ncbi:uncharacterized protein LOC132785436 isoform X1 [Drosophila nasuta]|uniref:uncharacterized protein LOC132785436 isoform X1 n=2 Tax=Drosophila nasuta TaxID=42062 RepID=UPI00295EECA8|nr:uncharacterized protein LOC132785436 isoform X1 [Drosophila nasuta]
MSVKIDNGKIETNVRLRHKVLADPERVRKDLEHQRRITRLQQVREKSNDIARHIRQETAAEKTRQVQKLESVKQKELNVWREHVMAKKHQDYRTAVFQVGAAHRAALVEIEKSEQQKQQQNERMKKCRRLAATNRVKHTPANVQRSTGGRDLNVEGRATAGTQTPVQKTTEGKENKKCCKSWKCPGKNKCQDAAEFSDCSWDNEQLEAAQRIECAPSNSSSGRQLQKTPPIILDVDIESEDSLEICTRNGIEINDRHMQTNRQFSRVVRSSPSSSPVRQTKKCVSRPRFTQISDLVHRNTMDEPPTTTTTSPTRSVQRVITTETNTTSPKRTSSPPAVVTSPKQAPVQKRSSLRNPVKQAPPAKVIDAGIKRSSAVQTVQQQPPVELSRLQSQPPLQDQATQVPQQQIQPHQQPQLPIQPIPMQPMPPYMPQPMPPHAVYGPPMMPGYAAPMMPYAYPMHPYPTTSNYVAPQPTQQASSNSATVVPPLPRTTTTTTTRSSVSTSSYVVRQKPGAETNTSGRVQFYDHNNKYTRNYKAPEESVQVNVPDASHLNAMDHARIETQLSKLREQELDKLRKVTEQRGQKALQREQVRRDCAELTEKLDALSQQQPQLLPSDANFVAGHRYADLASRREQKMNEVMEQMLLRPAIVTCPEVRPSSNHNSPRKCHHTKSNAPYAINVGDPPLGKGDDAVDTASCCSLLLDYVDDQSKQLRTELKGIHSKSAKSMKLRNLLQRIDKIRGQLLNELKAGDMSGDNAQKVIDSIRQERANLNIDMTHNLDEREMELQKKEAILEQRLRQLYRQQQRLADQKERQVKDSDEGTHEIIIKVRSDGTVKQCVPKGKSHRKARTTEPSKPTTSSSTGSSTLSTEKKQAEVTLNQRQNSIDSNSTAYRELPPVNYENIRAAVAATAPPPTPTVATSQAEPLNPIIAHYVQRLLTMSQSAINQLGVSSSDVSTPADSIVNQPGNISSGPTADDTLINSQRMERVQAFIQENRSFINELEDTLQREQEQQQQRQQQIPDQHTSEVFDEIWMKRLASKMQLQQQHKQKNLEHQAPQSQSQPEKDQTQTSQRGHTRRSVTIATDTESAARSLAQLLSSQMKSKQMAINELRTTSRTSEIQTQKQSQTQTQSKLQSQTTSKTQSQVINEVSSSSDKSAARHVERYAKLTENCTQRIAELTELITKVRGEKNRLVEVTLTSASEAERHSTEYFDLPPLHENGQKQLEQGGSRTMSEGSDATQSNSEALPLPLQKHKSTGASLDSGISVSRPMTALGQQELPEAEPLSLGSSSQPGTHRRGKAPPATIRRYSPQLAAEEMAHELSTITEIDTPAQSHIVAAQVEPIPFPTFEQYARELNVDVSQLDFNQSVRLQHEFDELIKSIREAGVRLDYREFPSIREYLHETSSTQLRIRTGRTSMEPAPSLTASQMMKEMRLSHVSVREFTPRHEYMERLMARLPPEERDMIDSASLDSTDSFNVEAELRQRHLLKASFKRGPPSDVDVASSTRRESVPPNASATAPDESGIEHLSHSLHEQARQQRPAPSEQQNHSRQYSGMHQRSLQHPDIEQPSIQHVGILNPSMHQRKQERQLHSNSSSSESERQPRRAGTSFHRSSENLSQDPPQEVSQMGRSLNLRDFLTKELLKHGRGRRMVSGSDGTDDSLKGQFLQSVIDSLSGSTSPATPGGHTHVTNATNDRQKTSTPVGSFTTGYEAGATLHSSDSQLFSMDSHISAVNYADGTPPIPYESQSMRADRGSASRNAKTAHK